MNSVTDHPAEHFGEIVVSCEVCQEENLAVNLPDDVTRRLEARQSRHDRINDQQGRPRFGGKADCLVGCKGKSHDIPDTPQGGSDAIRCNCIVICNQNAMVCHVRCRVTLIYRDARGGV